MPSPYSGPIVLTFSEHLASGSKADLVDASGATLASAVVDPNAMTMTFTLATPLAPGAYQVKWVSIADDGDVLRQPVIPFTVAAAAASPSATASAARLARSKRQRRANDRAVGRPDPRAVAGHQRVGDGQ